MARTRLRSSEKELGNSLDEVGDAFYVFEVVRQGQRFANGSGSAEDSVPDKTADRIRDDVARAAFLCSETNQKKRIRLVKKSVNSSPC